VKKDVNAQDKSTDPLGYNILSYVKDNYFET